MSAELGGFPAKPPHVLDRTYLKRFAGQARAAGEVPMLHEAYRVLLCNRVVRRASAFPPPVS